MQFNRNITMQSAGMRKAKRWIKINVTEPVTISTKDWMGTHSVTTYLICLNTNHWAFSQQHSQVRRRYSEFCWLRNKLQFHHGPNKQLPPLPKKVIMTRFDPNMIEERRNGLKIFLQRIMRSNVFLSDAALHLFIQSELSIPEIEAKLSEESFPILPTKTLSMKEYILGTSPPSTSTGQSSSFSNSETDSHEKDWNCHCSKLLREELNSSSDSDEPALDFEFNFTF